MLVVVNDDDDRKKIYLFRTSSRLYISLKRGIYSGSFNNRISDKVDLGLVVTEKL
jgi:hypothetical protein